MSLRCFRILAQFPLVSWTQKISLLLRCFDKILTFLLSLEKSPQKSDLAFQEPSEKSRPLHPIGLRVLKRPLDFLFWLLNEGKDFVQKYFLVDLKLSKCILVPPELTSFDVPGLGVHHAELHLFAEDSGLVPLAKNCFHVDVRLDCLQSFLEACDHTPFFVRLWSFSSPPM